MEPLIEYPRCIYHRFEKEKLVYNIDEFYKNLENGWDTKPFIDNSVSELQFYKDRCKELEDEVKNLKDHIFNNPENTLVPLIIDEVDRTSELKCKECDFIAKNNVGLIAHKRKHLDKK